MASKLFFYVVYFVALGDLANAGTIGNPEASACEVLPTGTTLTNKDDCSSYLYCENGEEEIKFCQIGYLYNPEVNECDLWSKIPDWARSRCTTEEGIREIGRKDSRAEEEEYVPTCDFSTTPFYIAHPTDCTLYFICYRGLVSREKCRSGEEWDCKAEKCVKVGGTPEECECRNPPVTPTPTEPTPTESTPDPTPTESTPEPTPTESTPDPTPTESTPEPTPTESTPESTPDPPSTQSTPNPSSTPPPPSEYSDICHGFAGTKTHYPGNCTVYIFCADSEPFLYPCPSNWLYDDTVNDCRPPSEVDPLLLKCSQGPPDTCDESATPERKGTLPDPFSCRRYYTCADTGAEPELTECDNGPLLFDPPTGVCVPSCELKGPMNGVDASRCYQDLPCRTNKDYFN